MTATSSTTVRLVLADLEDPLLLWNTVSTNGSEAGNETTSENAAESRDGQVGLNNWWAMLALVLVLGTAAGNILVCLAIVWERRLQNVTNYFLMSLAITDLMVAVLVMPLGILTLVRGECFAPSSQGLESARIGGSELVAVTFSNGDARISRITY
ncbi:hypothetical protein HN011_007272 [Eciton burchellii]|nr:hypothetical protein HN011_007272 [Eciton burchellii]